MGQQLYFPLTAPDSFLISSTRWVEVRFDQPAQTIHRPWGICKPGKKRAVLHCCVVTNESYAAQHKVTRGVLWSQRTTLPSLSCTSIFLTQRNFKGHSWTFIGISWYMGHLQSRTDKQLVLSVTSLWAQRYQNICIIYNPLWNVSEFRNIFLSSFDTSLERHFPGTGTIFEDHS